MHINILIQFKFLGEVAWRMYSDKYSIDLMTLMAEERNLTIDWKGFELAKEHTQVHLNTVRVYMEIF